MKNYFITLLLIMGGVLLISPDLAVAQTATSGLAQLSGCSGPDCTACNVVDMANGVIKWLIGILFVVFAVLMAVAGVKLVTSGGNSHALDEAKSSFTNAIIGFIIILAAWLIVDTIMRALVGTDGHEGEISITTGGKVTGHLFWAKVECQVVKTPTKSDPLELNYESVEMAWPGDSTNPLGSTNISTTVSCGATPAGNTNCLSAENVCKSSGGFPQIDKSNPTNFQINCIVKEANVTTLGSGSSGCAGGDCVPLTISCAARGCNIAPDMVSRLAGMHNSSNVSGARVTEAMPPSRQHKSACHSNGTCIDYSKAGGMTGSEVSRVISAASANGLRAVYEVQTQSQKNSLVATGAPASNIKVLGSWISAPHFSIYGQ